MKTKWSKPKRMSQMMSKRV